MIKSNYQNISCWGMSLLYSDDYFLPQEFDPISDNSNTSRIYALNIYMDDGLVYHTVPVPRQPLPKHQASACENSSHAYG